MFMKFDAKLDAKFEQNDWILLFSSILKNVFSINYASICDWQLFSSLHESKTKWSCRKKFDIETNENKKWFVFHSKNVQNHFETKRTKKNQIMKMKTIFVTINLHVKLKSKYFDNNELTFWQFDSYFSFCFLNNNNSIFLSITLLFNTFYRNKIRQRKFSHKIEIKIFWSKEINVFAKFRQKSNISFFVF